jgi:hypothetical protein
VSILHGLTDNLLASFRAVSRRWHRFIAGDVSDRPLETARNALQRLRDIGNQDPSGWSFSRPTTPAPRRMQYESSSQAESVKRRRLRITSDDEDTKLHASQETTARRIELRASSKQGSQLGTRATLWTQPALQRALEKLFGPHAVFRNEFQRDALRLLASNHPEILLVSPTGSGKTVLYVLPTLLPNAQVTIVISPLLALQQDLARRCMQWEVDFTVFTTRTVLLQASAIPNLVFVAAESASTFSF